VTADKNGQFRFDGLGPGRYCLARVRSFNTPGGGGMSGYLTSEESSCCPARRSITTWSNRPARRSPARRSMPKASRWAAASST